MGFAKTTLTTAGLLAFLALVSGDPTPCCPPVTHPLSASGDGEVKKTPDQVLVSFGVVTLRPTAQEAQQANTNANAAVVTSIVALGVDRKSIVLEGATLELKREYVPPPRNSNEEGRYVERGYEATRTISVELVDPTGEFSLLSPLLETIVKNGANKVQSVTYGLTPESLSWAKAEALALATTDALRRAGGMVAGLTASGINSSLGRVLSISEGGVAYYPIARSKVSFMADAAAAPMESTADTLPPGDLTIRASVSLTIELNQGSVRR